MGPNLQNPRGNVSTNRLNERVPSKMKNDGGIAQAEAIFRFVNFIIDKVKNRCPTSVFFDTNQPRKPKL